MTTDFLVNNNLEFETFLHILILSLILILILHLLLIHILIKAYLSKFTNSNTRPSSRAHHITRPTNLQPSILSLHTHGSSLVTLGETQVLCGITLSIGTPAPSQPTNGEIDVSVQFSPLSGKQYNHYGRIVHDDLDASATSSSHKSYSDPQAIESYIKRTIVSSEMIDRSQLGIVEGKSAWRVHVGCMVVNHDGNVVDAVILGVVRALVDLKLPSVVVDGEGVSNGSDDNGNGNGNDNGDGMVRYVNVEESEGGDECKEGNNNKPIGKMLDFKKICVPLTIGFFQGKMLVDPSLEEESLCEGMITVVVDALSLKNVKDDDMDMDVDRDDIGENSRANILTGNVLNLSKTGGGVLCSVEEIAACAQLAFGRAKELLPIILPSLTEQ